MSGPVSIFGAVRYGCWRGIFVREKEKTPPFMNGRFLTALAAVRLPISATPELRLCFENLAKTLRSPLGCWLDQ